MYVCTYFPSILIEICSLDYQLTSKKEIRSFSAVKIRNLYVECTVASIQPVEEFIYNNAWYCSNVTSHSLEIFCRVTSTCQADLAMVGVIKNLHFVSFRNHNTHCITISLYYCFTKTSRLNNAYVAINR